LTVELEAARAREGALPEGVEAMGKVGALIFENGEPLAVAFGVAQGNGFGTSAAVEFFAGVKDLEREDGEAVDHEARGLGVEWSIGVGETARSEFGKEGAVELFGKVVTALICGVDATLDSGEGCIGSAGGARFVFDVPELKVGAMLGSDEGEPAELRQWRLGGVGLNKSGVKVPFVGEAIVEFDDLGCGENDEPDLFGTAC